jgi:hypothetical protein
MQMSNVSEARTPTNGKFLLTEYNCYAYPR